MQTTELLHNLLAKSGAVKHKGRLKSILKGVDSLLRGGKLSLTSVGRHMRGSAKVKNKIKNAYNLTTNGRLQVERMPVYSTLAKRLLSGRKTADILVDWSPCGSHENQLLKASVVLRGRSVTLYEEVHVEKELGNYKVHQLFLKRLKSIIPKDIHVTIMTDAGFRTEWFLLVKEQGWDFVGRIRSKIYFQFIGGNPWKLCSLEHEFATEKPAYRGEVLLTKSNKFQCHMYLYKELKPIKAVPSKKKKKMSTTDKEYRKNAQEPWLLVTSLSPKTETSEDEIQTQALCVINKYRKRMKIEHEFRDSKDPQWGVGLAYTRCSDPDRLEILLLLGHLALFLLWLIGLATEYQKKHYDYQANTVKTHRVLSLVYLGTQVIFHQAEHITLESLSLALEWGRLYE